MTERGRHLARPTAFVGGNIHLVDAQHKGRIVVKEEGGDMVVVDQEQHINFLLLDPAAHRVEALEDRLPGRVVLFALVFGVAYGG